MLQSSFILILYCSFSMVDGSVIPCNNDPNEMAPSINGSRSDASLTVQEDGQLFLQCSAAYDITWIKLQVQDNKLPVSYTSLSLSNTANINTINQTEKSGNFLITLSINKQSDEFSIYACISTKDASSLRSSSTLDELKITKIFLRLIKGVSNCLRPKDLKAQAILETLNGNLLASRSATATLEQWCNNHKLAQSPKVVAKGVDGNGQSPPVPDDAKALLRVSPNDTIKYRKVELSCGDKVLSVADNWYVANRLTPEMNDILGTSNTPYGKVVAPLEPYRQTNAVNFLWQPLPDNWDMTCTGPSTGTTIESDKIPDKILEHKAVVVTNHGIPISYVDEQYTKAMLDFL